MFGKKNVPQFKQQMIDSCNELGSESTQLHAQVQMIANSLAEINTDIDGECNRISGEIADLTKIADRMKETQQKNQTLCDKLSEVFAETTTE